ncbi:polyketide cyclase [Pedobacter sp. HMF7647]|uniref:Polyketide cyclase n=1 Tax=Hufsiella arboris TaxID=2695275 RepID=A0A7K1YFS2_9SPHI|nr:SRPBCC family protein [Hufsiella arboris]MXV52968.1 polyketide cyclase [Hufsiella arboris]
MKFLKTLLIVIVALIIIFFAGALFLPKTYSVARSVNINAPDSVVYKNVSDLNLFKKWMPWLKMEPTAKVEISGEPSSPGHSYHWVGDKTGEGIMSIKQVVPYSHVDYDLKFIKPFESDCNSQFTIESSGGTVDVTWTMSGENKTTMEKWMSLNFDNMIGKDFESGLKDLKKLSEKQ